MKSTVALRSMAIAVWLCAGAPAVAQNPSAAQRRDTVDVLLDRVRQIRRSTSFTDTAGLSYTRRLAQNALQLARRRNDAARESDALDLISWLFWLEEQWSPAAKDSDQAYTVAAAAAARRSTDSTRILQREIGLANMYAATIPDSSRHIFARVIAALRRGSDTATLATALGDLAEFETTALPDSAVRHASEALRLHLALHDTAAAKLDVFVVGEVAGARAKAAQASHRPAEAVPTLRMQATLARLLGTAGYDDVIGADTTIASLFESAGAPDSAGPVWQEIVDAALPRRDVMMLERTLPKSVADARRRGDDQLLIRRLKTRAEIAYSSGRDSTLVEIATVYTKLGRPDSAMRYLAEADIEQARSEDFRGRFLARWRTRIAMWRLVRATSPDSATLFLKGAFAFYKSGNDLAADSSSAPRRCIETAAMLLGIVDAASHSAEDYAPHDVLHAGYAVRKLPEEIRRLAGSGDVDLPPILSDAEVTAALVHAWATLAQRAEAAGNARAAQNDLTSLIGARENGPQTPTRNCETYYDPSRPYIDIDTLGDHLIDAIDEKQTLLVYTVAGDTLVSVMAFHPDYTDQSARVAVRSLGPGNLVAADMLPPTWAAQLRDGPVLVALPPGPRGRQIETLLRGALPAGRDIRFAERISELIARR
jgi:hypothetical protein